MPKVFISRALQQEGPFLQLKSQPGWDLTAMSLIQFEAVAFDKVTKAEWLFFYSGKGVQFFFEQAALSGQVKLAALGPGTARQLEERGYQPAFVGQGAPEEVAADFLKVARQQSVIFVQARRSRKSIQWILGQKIEGMDLVVYDNVPQPVPISTDTDYLIFTSPLNFETYQQCNRIYPKQRLIGIGPTTGKSFQIAGVENYRIASQSTESALLSCLLNWQKERPL